MPRISGEARDRNEKAVRAAMEALLAGQIPPGGKADLKTLAAQAGITRTGFYPKKNRDGTERPGPYQHLAEEFERRLKALQDQGEVVDARAGQIARLKDENAALKERIAERDTKIEELTAFKKQAISRLAAQHAEIERLRAASDQLGKVRALRASDTHGGT
jgi:phage shock protein A